MGRAALLALGLIALAAAADEAPGPSVQMSATPAQVDVGREVTVALAYAWPRGWTPVAEPDPATEFTDLFVTSFPPPEVIRTGEREERRWRLSVLAPMSGTWALPRPTLTVRDPAGAESSAQAPEVLIQVGAADDPPQLAPPRPLWIRPESVAEPAWRTWLPIAIAGAAVAAATAIALRRRRSADAAVTPRERFALELDAVRAAGDGKEASARLSLALRGYAGAIWRFDGHGSTAREVAAALRGRAPDGEARAIVRLLEELDAWRWSPDQLPPSQVLPLVDQARELVTGIQRRLDEEARAAAAAAKTGQPATTTAP